MSNPEPDIKAALALLRYDLVWLESGFLSRDELRAKKAYFDRSEDKSTEHYRYATFLQILASRETMSDDEIARYIDLTQRDSDIGMAEAARCKLIQWEGLTAAQIHALSQQPLFATPIARKLILRRQLLTELDTHPLTPDLFQRCLTSADVAVYRQLLNCDDLTHEQTQFLAEQDQFRKIRNIAAQQAKRKRADT